MRLAIFWGLLFIAYCTNQLVFDAVVKDPAVFMFLIGITVIAFLGDIKDLIKKE